MLAKRILVLIIGALLLSGICAWAAAAKPTPKPSKPAAKPADEVVAIVNGEKITKSELLSNMYNWTSPMGTEITIITRLIAQEAKKEGITVSDSEVAKELEKAKQSTAQTGGNFEESVKSSGFTIAHTKNMLKNQLLADKILRKRAVVTPEEMAQYRGVKQIVLMRTASRIPSFPGAETSAEGANAKDPDEEVAKKIDQIAQEIKGGLSFDEAIKQYSMNMGPQQAKDAVNWYKLGSAPSDIDKTISELEVNEISAPVKSPGAYHLIQVVASGAKISGAQAAELKAMIVNSKVDVRGWMMKLRNEAKIDSKLVAKRMGAATQGPRSSMRPIPPTVEKRRIPANSRATEGNETPPAPPAAPTTPPAPPAQ